MPNIDEKKRDAEPKKKTLQTETSEIRIRCRETAAGGIKLKCSMLVGFGWDTGLKLNFVLHRTKTTILFFLLRWSNWRKRFCSTASCLYHSVIQINTQFKQINKKRPTAVNLKEANIKKWKTAAHGLVLVGGPGLHPTKTTPPSPTPNDTSAKSFLCTDHTCWNSSQWESSSISS